MDTKIKAVVQSPGEISKITQISDTIEAFNRVVGGASARVALGVGKLFLVINNYGGAKPNLTTDYGIIQGPVIVVAMDNGLYVSMTVEEIQAARAWLLLHSL